MAIRSFSSDDGSGDLELLGLAEAGNSVDHGGFGHVGNTEKELTNR